MYFWLAHAPKPVDTSGLAAIYKRDALTERQQVNPIIWIPGISGSQLATKNSGEVVWGGVDRLGIDPSEPAAARILAVPFLEATRPVIAAYDDLHSTKSLRKVRPRLLGLVFEQNIYAGAIRGLSAGGYDLEEQNQVDAGVPGRRIGFEFHYDWRRDLVEAAQQLNAFVQRKRKSVEHSRRARFGPKARPVKFDIITHSIGGSWRAIT